MDGPTFTARQLEVLRLIARGYSNEEVGERLSITTRTAKAHADVLRVKLGVPKRRQVPLAYMASTGHNPYPTAADVAELEVAAC